MIKIAFLLNFTKEYKGGINYIKNLLYACSVERQENIKFYIFVPSDIEKEYIDSFSPYAEIVKTDIFKRKSLPWLIEKVLEKKFNTNFLIPRLLKKYKIDIVSHSNYFTSRNNVKIINWIPDFQILHYPELWSTSERDFIINQYKNIVKYSDRIIVSSNNAFDDYCSFTTEKVDKVRVLQFVSQPGSISDAELMKMENTVKEKYNIHGDFFYLPNQFWSHKNHITVFKAINLLKERGLNPLLITTGYMADFRGKNTKLKDTLDYVKNHNLSNNILLLGLIPYSEVLFLIRSCLALINPSLFEGWSSTVEEAKSTGKQILLSDIAIHREQNPDNGIYFDPLDEVTLANIMEKVLAGRIGRRSEELDIKQEVKDDLVNRTKLFAKKYQEIIAELVIQ